MAITADDRDKYRPSLWSAAIDQAVVRRSGQAARLIAISAGNLLTQPGDRYPDTNHLASVQDPSQAWNALTVGAFTEMVQLKEPIFKGWSPIAPPGRLSPASTTSIIWPTAWPIKPELVLEGGNYATDGAGSFSDAPDLSLLTTRLSSTGALLGLTRATSPAAGQAARMAAIIQANYPDYWRGNAGQLADSGSIAIFPITGWWRERPNQGCVEKVARYSLIVTIRTQKAELEVYNWVANEVQIPTEIIVE